MAESREINITRGGTPLTKLRVILEGLRWSRSGSSTELKSPTIRVAITGKVENCTLKSVKMSAVTGGKKHTQPPTVVAWRAPCIGEKYTDP